MDGAPPFWAISEMTFASRAAFDAAMARHGEAIFAACAGMASISAVTEIVAMKDVRLFNISASQLSHRLGSPMMFP